MVGVDGGGPGPGPGPGLGFEVMVGVTFFHCCQNVK